MPQLFATPARAGAKREPLAALRPRRGQRVVLQRSRLGEPELRKSAFKDERRVVVNQPRVSRISGQRGVKLYL